jgi:hypothetical protein
LASASAALAIFTTEPSACVTVTFAMREAGIEATSLRSQFAGSLSTLIVAAVSQLCASPARRT